ncbi:hypothetical protein NDA13_004833 [Ustilago tritici]|nr:hypothetical protein NDA13_004833 [Ustilago tritici]
MPPEHPAPSVKSMQTDPTAETGSTSTIDSIDPSKFAPIEEPDEGAFLVYLDSELVWTNKSENHVTVPFEELPLPSRISFPTGVGRGKFVDITIGPGHLELLTKAQLSFNKQKLELTLVSPKLPPSMIILKILDVPFQVDARSAAQTVAFKIHEQQVVKTWDIWKVEHGLPAEFSDSKGRHQYSLVAALVPTVLPSGKIAATTIISIPGYIPLHHKHCLLDAHIGLLSYDTGILICHTDWVVEEVSHTSYSTYVRIQIPDDQPAISSNVCLLHVWSIHAPPSVIENIEFWQSNNAGLSRLQHIDPDPSWAAIVGGDWNTVPCLYTDVFPAGLHTRHLPHQPFNLAHLSDAFQILHPTQPSFTRHHIIMGELLSSHCLDSIWVSMDLLPALLTANTKSSPSDHAAVSISLRTSSAVETHGPDTWRLHRDIHQRPAFAEWLRRFSAQLDLAIPLCNAPIQAWLDFKEQTRTAAHNLSLEISSHLHLQQQPHLSLLAHIELIEIRAGPTA